MTIAFLPLPPVIDQTIHRVPLDAWSSAAFLVIMLAAGFLAYRRSPIVLGVLAFAVPFAAYRDIGNTTITIEKCIAFGTAAGLILSGVPLLPRSKNARRVFYAGSILLLTIFLSLSHASFPLHVAREFFKQAEYLAIFWCAATLLEQAAASQKALFVGVGASSLIVSTLAVAQATIGGAPSGIWVNGHPLPRVAGTLEGPNQLAGFLEAALPVLWVASLLTSWIRPVWSYVTGASAAALILTQSRAGVFVVALSYFILSKIDPRKARTSLLPTLIGATCGFAVAVAWFVLYAHASWSDVERLFLFAIPQAPGGVGTRAQLWPAALALFSRSPLTGVGAGNFELLLPSVGVNGVQTHASSLWLQTLAEQGLVGLIALASFAFVALRETFRLRLGSPLALAAFLAITSLLVHQLVDDLFFFPKVAALAWLLLGAGTVMPPAVEPSTVTNGRASVMVARGAVESTTGAS